MVISEYFPKNQMKNEYRIRSVGDSPIRRLIAAAMYCTGRTLRISPFSRVSNSRFEGRCKIFRDVMLVDSSVGYGTYVGWRSEISKAKIGRFCSIAPNVKILSGAHPTHLVSSHPMFYSTQRQNGASYTESDAFDESPTLPSGYAVEIGSDTWIGNNAIILPKITVGVGAIVAAGSIVTRDVEPYQIVAGNPAKPIRLRHEQSMCDLLLQSRWWERDLDWIRINAHKFLDINTFICVANLQSPIFSRESEGS